MDTVPGNGRHHKTWPAPKEAVLEVLEFDAHGRARATFEGKTVEVDHGIPGELVEALVHGRRRRWARIVNILQPSPQRVVAPCPHFHGGCGGCPWQMLSYASQLDRKLASIRSAFADAGLKVSVSCLGGMENAWRYRRTASLSLGRQVGFRRHGTQSIVGIEDCPISHPSIGQLASFLNRCVEGERLPNFRGEVALEVRVVEAQGREFLHTAIVPSPGSRHASPELVQPLTECLTESNLVTGVMYRHRQNPPQLLYGEPYGTVKVMDHPFAVSAATFFQTNLRVLPDLLAAVVDAASATASHTVVDVYGGVGLFGLLLAPSVDRVIEIEIDAVSIEAARLSASWQGLRNIDFLCGTAEGIMASVERADTVIVDPPRAGLTPKVVEAFGRLRPARILYVSCLAKSLVRDILSFREYGYTCGPVQAFDFYPQTYHVELFTLLTVGPNTSVR